MADLDAIRPSARLRVNRLITRRNSCSAHLSRLRMAGIDKYHPPSLRHTGGRPDVRQLCRHGGRTKDATDASCYVNQLGRLVRGTD